MARVAWILLILICSSLLVPVVKTQQSIQTLAVPASGRIVIRPNGNSASLKAELQQNSPAPGVANLPSSANAYYADLQRSMSYGKSYCSSYCSTTSASTLKSCVETVLKKQSATYQWKNLDQVNWVLNNFVPGTIDGESSCGKGVLSADDVQKAIWSILGQTVSPSCRSGYITNRAQEAGAGFVPVGCSDSAAVLALSQDCQRPTNVQVILFYVPQKTITGICAPVPRCSIPQLPSACIGVSYKDFIPSPTTPIVDLSGRRNLTCSECRQYLDVMDPKGAPHKMPPGCECPMWPCCAVTEQAAGSGCPACPAAPRVRPFSQALAGPGGCVSAASSMLGSSISPYTLKDSVYLPLIPILQSFSSTSPPGPTIISATAARIANLISQASTSAIMRWFQWACVCSDSAGSGYDEATMLARIQAVAAGVAQAYAAAQATIKDDGFAAFAATAEDQAKSIGAVVSGTLMQVLPKIKAANPSQCVSSADGGKPAIESLISSSVSSSIVCTIARALGSVFYVDFSNPANSPLFAKTCACSYTMADVPPAVLGSIAETTVCLSNCPRSDSPCPCLATQLYSTTKLMCVPSQ